MASSLGHVVFMSLEFICSIAKVQTLADGGIRVALSLPESELVAMAQCAAWQLGGVAVKIVAEAAEKPVTDKSKEAW